MNTSLRHLESGATHQDVSQIFFLLVHEIGQLRYGKEVAVRVCAHELQKGRVSYQGLAVDQRVKS